MLSHVRVIDLCDGESQFAAYLLAMMGAEVIAVESPTGSATRRRGPFVDDVEDLDRSLTHWAYNRGKRSVVADLGTEEGRDSVRRLAATADILFEDARPGALGAIGLGQDDLAELNPALVHVSITPYGSTGPRADWLGTDLTAMAGSSYMQSTGDADRAPLRVGVPQSFLHAGGDAADAALIALRERRRSGLGQHVDVSAQESWTIGQPQNTAPLVNANLTERMAGGTIIGGLEIPLLFRCRDGHTVCVMLMGAVLGRFSERVVAWEIEEGFGNDELAGIDWENFAYQLISGEVSVDVLLRANDVHREFLATKTKAELWEAAFERNVLVTPSHTVADLVSYEHLEARGFWHDEELDDGRVARFARRLAPMSTDEPAPPSPPPTLGADTGAVDLDRRPDVTQAVAASAEGSDALAGLNVLEFSWVIATPSAVRVLADYGATVVKVESEQHPDTMRTVNPFVDEEVHPDNSVGYGVYNAGKKCVTLDLANPASRDVVLDLVRWADVVTESFAPGAIDRLGFGYEELSAVNPQLIMLSSTLLGQDGPHAGLAGYGFMAAAIAGFYDITGWPDRDPAGPYGPYTDFTSPRVMLATILAALENRDRTGRGTHIDMSQTEGSLHFLGPAILDQTVNGRTFERCGNDDPEMYPHGVFPSSAPGDDAWVAVACTDEMWPRLAGLIGLGELAGLDRQERRARRDEIDAAVTSWTSSRSNDESAEQLQAAAVAAYPVHHAAGTNTDPQLAHRGHHIEVPQSYRGTMWTQGCRTTMSRTPAVIRRGGPNLGEDNYEVLAEILGYDADRIADLAAAEALQ